MERPDFLELLEKRYDLETAGGNSWNLAGLQPARMGYIEEEVKPLLLNPELEMINNQSKLITRRLDYLLGKLGRPVNPARLAANYVWTTIDATLHNQALELLSKVKEDSNYVLSFIPVYDIFYGAKITVSLLLSAVNPDNAEIVEEFGTPKFDGRYLYLPDPENYPKFQTAFSRCKALLEKDPSGFSLIEEGAKSLRGQPNEIAEYSDMVPPFLVSEFVATGANFAEALYKAIYPVAEKRLTTPQ